MTRYRKNLYKAQAVVWSIIAFWALAMYSQWHVSPEGQRAHMDKIHAQALADYEVHTFGEMFSYDPSKPVILYNMKKKKWEEL